VAYDGRKRVEKTLEESIRDLEKLKKIQEKSLNLKAAKITQKTIDALKGRIK
jgi:cell fate (sporulation/competence/biofilm development) regulator YlbF (YheA/YmcA/DUF963 family)